MASELLGLEPYISNANLLGAVPDSFGLGFPCLVYDQIVHGRYLSFELGPNPSDSTTFITHLGGLMVATCAEGEARSRVSMVVVAPESDRGQWNFTNTKFDDQDLGKMTRLASNRHYEIDAINFQTNDWAAIWRLRKGAVSAQVFARGACLQLPDLAHKVALFLGSEMLLSDEQIQSLAKYASEEGNLVPAVAGLVT